MNIFSGPNNGACVLLEKQLGKNLLFLACRHHVFELIAKETFFALFGETSSPNTAQFVEIQKSWATIDKNAYRKLEDDRLKGPFLKKLVNENLSFLETLIENGNQFVRDDYKELAELSVLILGGAPKTNFCFKRCGPIHHARWMAKIIYTMKIYLFR